MEFSKNHRDDDENVEHSGIIPYLNIMPNFNPGLYLERYMRFLPQDCPYLLPQPRIACKKFDINSKYETVLYESNRKVGEHTVRSMMPTLSKLIGGPHCTNHQIRTTAIKALRRAGFDWANIMKCLSQRNMLIMWCIKGSN